MNVESWIDLLSWHLSQQIIKIYLIILLLTHLNCTLFIYRCMFTTSVLFEYSQLHLILYQY